MDREMDRAEAMTKKKSADASWDKRSSKKVHEILDDKRSKIAFSSTA